LVRESDQRLIQGLQQSESRDLGSYASEYGIKFKTLLEDVGLLDPMKYVVE